MNLFSDLCELWIVMRTALFIMLILSLTGVTVSAQSRSENPRSTVFSDGEFQFIGGAPPGLEGFENFYLGSVKVTRKTAVVARGSAGVFWLGVEYPISVITTRGRRLDFTTRRVKGVRFTFSGEFPAIFERDDHGNPNGTVLSGRLTKYSGSESSGPTAVKFLFQTYSD